jgi:uncharacterized protein (DUF302 family)
MRDTRNAPEAAGIVTRPSPYSSAETLAHVEARIAERGLALFARFDHAAAARAVGLLMQDSCVLVFGSPAAGTPVMVASPLVALELPLRILVWSDSAGRVWVSYADPKYLGSRFGLPDALVRNIGAVGDLVEAALA